MSVVVSMLVVEKGGKRWIPRTLASQPSRIGEFQVQTLFQ